jgi:hypothetical protein
LTRSKAFVSFDARARGWRTGSGWVVVIGEEDFVLGLTGGSDAA